MKSRKEKVNKVQNHCNLQTCQKEASKKCSRCRCVFYCDKSCQTKDWPVHKSNCKAIRNVRHGKNKEKHTSSSKQKLHDNCWQSVRNPVTNEIIKIVDPTGKTYNIDGGKMKPSTSDPLGGAKDDNHKNCLRPIRDPGSDDIIGVVDSSAYFYKVKKDGPRSIDDTVNKRVQEANLHDSNVGIKEVGKRKWGELFWDLDWRKIWLVGSMISMISMLISMVGSAYFYKVEKDTNRSIDDTKNKEAQEATQHDSIVGIKEVEKISL